MQILLRVGIALCLTALLSGAMPFVMRNDPRPGGAACSMAYDTVSTGASVGAGVTTINWNHLGAANVTAVALLYQDFNHAVTSPTYGGNSMGAQATTQTDSSGTHTGIFGLANPPTGTQNVVINFGTGDFVAAAVVSVTCSNTTTVFDPSPASNTGTSATPSQAVNSTTAEVVVDILAGYSGSAPATAIGTGHTARVTALSSGGNNLWIGTMPGQAGTTTPGWSMTSGVFTEAAASFAHQ
jgi:hypothetical protein